MSNSARDLLVRGMAAAVAGSLEEAHFYLLWVLRTDATLDQEADAHYWLSRVTSDPAQKREHLENVLAAFPHYPEARRDLAILEGRLKPEEMVDHHRGVTPISPSAHVAPPSAQKQQCPRCGARMAYNAHRGMPTCQFCGYREGADPALSPGIEEGDWTAAIYSQRGHKWVLPTARVLQCRGCGATVSVTPSHASAECPFCSSPYVLVEQGGRDLIEPEAVLPFGMDEHVALSHARQWIGEQRFRPDDLDELAAFTISRSLYIPFWTFDVEGEVRWTQLAPETQYGHKAGTTEHGSHLVSYNDVLVPATRSLSPELLSELDYDTGDLKPYSPGVLVDWPAEIYSVSAADASIEALARVRKNSKAIILDSLPNRQDGAGNVRIEPPAISITGYKLVLLPAWLTHYTYRGQEFDVAINGATGETHGDLPRTRAQSFLGGLFGS